MISSYASQHIPNKFRSKLWKEHLVSLPELEKVGSDKEVKEKVSIKFGNLDTGSAHRSFGRNMNQYNKSLNPHVIKQKQDSSASKTTTPRANSNRCDWRNNASSLRLWIPWKKT